tara:strand:+ start:336 stop:701 length:366 start_codon:yes stop_codon:yes gene_type:complete
MKHITANTHINDIVNIVNEQLIAAQGTGAWDSTNAHQQGIKCMASINANEPQLCFEIPQGARMLNGQEAITAGINNGISQGIQATVQDLQQRFGGKVKARIGAIAQPRIYLFIDHTVKQTA